MISYRSCRLCIQRTAKRSIKSPPGAIAHIIFRLPMLARMMTYRDLADSIPFDLQQDRQKPMHTIVELDGPQTVSSVSSQRTPDIDDVIVQDASAHMVGKLGGHPPQPGILSALPNATDHIVIVEHLQHVRDIAGIVLQVGIQGDYSCPRTSLNPASSAALCPALCRKRIIRTSGCLAARSRNTCAV